MKNNYVDNGPMLNAYPDSMGGTLSDIVSVLSQKEFEDVFQSFYILPSIFNTDLDRGFSVIDYSINEEMAGEGDLQKLEDLGIDLKLDFILNHASVLSPQFQDLIKNGEGGYIYDCHDVDGFAEGMTKIANNNTSLRMKEINLMQIKDFDKDIVNIKMEQIYKGLLYENNEVDGDK